MRSAAQKTRSDAANEHPVFPAQCHLLHELLDLVIVNRHQSITLGVEQVLELIPQVGQCLPEDFFRHHVHERGTREVFPHPLPDRTRLRIAECETVFWRVGLGPVFDVVELLEHGQQHAGLEGAVLSRIEDLPPRMRHAGSLE